MKLSRPSRFVAALIALLSMLFMQLAVAGYVCPGFKIALVSNTVAMHTDAGSMPGCDDMDMEQPSLCNAQVQVGSQSLDRPELPHVQPFIAATLTLVFDDIEPAYDPILVPSDSHLLTRSSAPPLSIRNCCFRI
jgi:hypothetical protein